MTLRSLLICLLALLATFPSPAHGQSLSEVFQRVAGSVVVIYTAERDLDVERPGQLKTVGGLGSGVLISQDGHVLTAAHVVQAADSVAVEFPNGQAVRARVVNSVPTADLALLRLEGVPRGVTPAVLGDSDLAEVGDEVFVIGAPLGISHTLTVGHISARREMDQTMGSMFSAEFLQTDAAVNQGNSGGPMFNMNGEVIGIVSFMLSQTGGFEGLGFVVTSRMARELVLSGPQIWSGVDGLLMNEGLAQIFNVPPPAHGWLVQKVAAGSLGERIGLQAGAVKAVVGGKEIIVGGDIVLAVQGVTVTRTAQSEVQRRAALSRLTPGDRIVLSVLRSGQVIELGAVY
jgi:S1-C subfamily serine protease